MTQPTVSKHCCPTNSVKALKATSAFGLGEDPRVLLGVTCTISISYRW